MYTIPAKTTVQTKTIISAFEKGHVKSLNIADTDEVDQSKPQHPELCREELAEPGTARKLLLAFESKRAESQKTQSAGKSPSAAKLSLDKFSTFEDKTVTVKVEKQVNGSAVNGSEEVDVITVIKVEKTAVISNADVKATTADVQIEKKTIEISKDNTVNGDSATLHLESTTISTTKAHESVQEIKHDEVKKEIVEEVESRVEEKIETAVERAVQEKVEEKIEEKISDRIEKTVENSKDAKEISIDVKLTVASDSDEQTKVAEKIEEKIEEKVEEKVKEHVEKKIENHNGVADKVEAKIEEKVRENVEDNIEEIVRENLKEKVIDSKEEKIAKKLSDEEKKITVTVSVTKSADESSKVTNGAAVTHAVKVGQPKMALIVSAVRAEGGLDATLRYASMKALEDQGLNVLYTDAHNISRSKSGGPDFEGEREKLLQAELIILHFRPILNSPPAALKLWLEGTLIQSSGKFIDKSLLKGKKAIILVTTDADQVPDEKLINLPFLASVQDDILRAIDMNVISPFLIFEAREGLDEIVQRKHVDAWVTKLASALL